MALFFDADGEEVDHGSDTSLDDLTTKTFLFWCNPSSSIGTSDMLLLKQSTDNTVVSTQWGDSSKLACYQKRGGADSDARETATGLLTQDTWQYIACTYDSIANPRWHIYRGTLSTLATEASYSFTSPLRSGSIDDAAGNLYIGSDAASAQTWRGSIATVMILDTVLSLAEIQRQQFSQQADANCVLYCHYGFNGTGTQVDYSGTGNSGTVTGATQTAHVPLAPPFGISIPWVPAPAAGDLSVNVSDDVEISESVTVTLPDPLAVSPSDDVETSDTVKLQLDSFVAASDDVTVADSVSVEVSAPQASASDDATITDAISVVVSAPQIDVSDDATIADTASVSIVSAADLAVNVSDDATIADAATADIQLNVVVSDDLTISDTVTLAMSDPQIAIADNVTIADTVTADVVIEVTASDNATIADSTTVTVSDPQIVSSDNVTIADSTGVSIIDAGAIAVNVSDDATVTDAITISVSAPAIGVSDSIDVSDSATVEVIAAALGVDISYDNLDAWVRGVRVTA
jgi:hypothetical protein